MKRWGSTVWMSWKPSAAGLFLPVVIARLQRGTRRVCRGIVAMICWMICLDKRLLPWWRVLFSWARSLNPILCFEMLWNTENVQMTEAPTFSGPRSAEFFLPSWGSKWFLSRSTWPTWCKWAIWPWCFACWSFAPRHRMAPDGPGWRNGRTAPRFCCVHSSINATRMWFKRNTHTHTFSTLINKSMCNKDIFGITIEDWLVVWNINFIFPYIGNNHPNWLRFFRGVAQPPTRRVIYHRAVDHERLWGERLSLPSSKLRVCYGSRGPFTSIYRLLMIIEDYWWLLRIIDGY